MRFTVSPAEFLQRQLHLVLARELSRKGLIFRSFFLRTLSTPHIPLEGSVHPGSAGPACLHLLSPLPTAPLTSQLHHGNTPWSPPLCERDFRELAELLMMERKKYTWEGRKQAAPGMARRHFHRYAREEGCPLD